MAVGAYDAHMGAVGGGVLLLGIISTILTVVFVDRKGKGKG